MRARLVSESYEYSFENQLYESVLNEKFNIQSFKKSLANVRDKNKFVDKLLSQLKEETTSYNIKKNIGIALCVIFMINMGIKNNKWAASKEYNEALEKAGTELAAKEEVNKEDIKTQANKIANFEKHAASPIFSVGAAGLIDEINKVKPGRLNVEKVPRYDKYDGQILQAAEELRRAGEKPNIDLIKGIMLYETGMKPVKNKWGFEGFPQTKQHIIDGINKRYKTNFTMKDMYSAKESAKFIHYYLKAVKRSTYVKSKDDMFVGYNQGIGNLGKYKRGEEKMPQQAIDYVAAMKVLEKYFS
jgi:hypothetical protein